MSDEVLEVMFNVNNNINNPKINIPLLNANISKIYINNSELNSNNYIYNENGITFNFTITGINRVKINWNGINSVNKDDKVILGNEFGWINPNFLIQVIQWHNNPNNNYCINSFDYAFYNCVNLISVPTSIPNNVSSLDSMFEKATNFNQYIGDWNITSVSGLSSMFKEAYSFNKPFTNWDTTNITSMNNMFEKASSFNQNINNFVTTNVSDMSYMFANAISFNQPIGNWDTSNVEYMNNMFQNALSFNQNISNWIIDSVTDFTDFLSYSGLDIENYNKILINWSNSDSGSHLIFGAQGLQYSGIDAYNAHNNLTDDNNGYYWTIEGDSYILPSSICFCKGTLINTDRGLIAIEKINPNYITINKKKIIAVTKTIQPKNSYLVCFEKDSIFVNYPNKKTIMSRDHKLYYKDKMIESYKFVGHFKNVYKIEYKNEILYNILMEEHNNLLANNLICETLHPDNLVAKLYNTKTTENEKKEIVYKLENIKNNLNTQRQNKNQYLITYNK